MKKFRSYVIAILLPAILCAAKSAGRYPNLSGKWILNEAKSELNNNPMKWAYKQITIAQSNDSIKIASVLMGKDGVDSTSVETLSYNGGTSKVVLPNTSRGVDIRYRSITVSANGQTLILAESHEITDDDRVKKITIAETWTLSANGKELIINKEFEFVDGNVKVKALYDRL